MNVQVPKFDWTINFGHVLTIATLLVGGFLAYLSIEIRISQIDVRTIDYQEVRDQVKLHEARLMALDRLVSSNSSTNQIILSNMSVVREDIASIKALLRDDQ